MTKALDKKDWKILKLLCADARMSRNTIAKKVSLSKNAITYRIDRLQRMGVIERFSTIINHEAMGLHFYEILVKKRGKDNDPRLIEFLKKNGHVVFIGSLVGEWNLVFEFACTSISVLCDFIEEMKRRFNTIIKSYALHPVLFPLSIEQLPHVRDKTNLEPYNKVDIQKYDELDNRILRELNKDASIPYYVIAQRLGITAETVSSRIKRLKQSKIIIKFSAIIDTVALDFDEYLVLVETNFLGPAKEQEIFNYLMHHNAVLYSSLSAAKPVFIIYTSVKDAKELDSFLSGINDIMLGRCKQQYFYLQSLYYNLWPDKILDT